MNDDQKPKLDSGDVQPQKSEEVVPTTWTIKELMKYDVANDQDTILGNRWLTRGASCVWVGPSGVGKSWLTILAAVQWALGKPLYGIKPKKPLKSIILQAENGFGDVSEMIQGVLRELKIDQKIDPTSANGSEEVELINQNIILMHANSVTGDGFLDLARRLCATHKPDLMWVDPILAFIGGDISNQEVASEFLRNGLNKIALQTNVCWMIVHHTGKPSKNGYRRPPSGGLEISYAGLGSSELTNWARAVNVLEHIKDGTYALRFSKRGKRAGLVDLNGNPTSAVYLRHGIDNMCWQEVEAPVSALKHSTIGTLSKKVSATARREIEYQKFKKIVGDMRVYKDAFEKYHQVTGKSESTFKRYWNPLLAERSGNVQGSNGQKDLGSRPTSMVPPKGGTNGERGREPVADATNTDDIVMLPEPPDPDDFDFIND